MRVAGSAAATLLGALLLLGDSTDDCGEYAAFKTEFDYVTDCPGGETSGHVSFYTPAVSNEGRAGDYAKESLGKGGLPVANAYVEFRGDCSGGDGTGHVEAVNLRVAATTLPADQYQCARLPLPVTAERTITCNLPDDAGTKPSCTITVSPPAKD